MTIKILRNATIFDGHGEELTDGGSIVIEGDRIREVGGSRLRCDGDEVVDLAGRFLMPWLLEFNYYASGLPLHLHHIDSLTKPLQLEHVSLRRLVTLLLCQPSP